MVIIYDLLFVIYMLLYIPYLCIRRKWHKGFFMRWGCFPQELRGRLAQRASIWIHAVSVGEVMVSLPLMTRLARKYPQYQIVCTTVTKTGYALAKEQLAGKGVVLYAPLDASWIVRRCIQQIRPKVYMAVETELWPNLYHALAAARVPIVQINGRISDRAFQRYCRVRWLTRRVLKKIHTCCVQTLQDAQRFKALGADPHKVQVLGNLKFDNTPDLELVAGGAFVAEDEDCLIGGSTHPGEEAILIQIYTQLRKDFPQLRLVLAPRHIERTEEVVNLVYKAGYRSITLTALGQGKLTGQEILVVDTIGQLRWLYQQATLVFVGKTLKVGGGQNMIEPAFFGKVTFVGPQVANFRDVVDILLRQKALVQVQDQAALLERMRFYLEHATARVQMGALAQRIIRQNQGALDKTFDWISQCLEDAT